MEFDLSFFLLAVPVAFGLGWIASRLDMRQLRMENRQAPKAYFKGLNFLLNEQQDQAIDAFIEAVQSDPDTSELHFALGNLFRRRGEYERAVRVHQHLLARGDLSAADLHRAQYALALDYLKAGLLDRAEAALLKLEGTAFELEARLALLANYERSRDWEHAAQIAKKLEASDQGSFGTRLAHYLCEQASALQAPDHIDAAQALLQQAINTAPEAPRPRLDFAKLLQKKGDVQAAYAVLLDALHASPMATPLIAQELAALAHLSGNYSQTLAELQSAYEHNHSLDVLQAIVTTQLASAKTTAPQLETQPSQAAQLQGQHLYAQHLAQNSSLVAAAKWFSGLVSAQPIPSQEASTYTDVQRALDHAAKPLLRYRCAACGFEASRHFWQCPGCQTWDSYPARRIEEL